ncbi:MAG: hypothetical protein K8T89_14445 [Planctomycetes bacterium]|nr:hypothetical protein [Planctomycetota bacterium]
MRLIRLEDYKGEALKYECTPEVLAEAYRLARESFTAADLQKCTEPMDDGVPGEEVLREMEEQQARFDAQRIAESTGCQDTTIMYGNEAVIADHFHLVNVAT